MGFRYKIFIISVLFFYSCDDFFLSELDECGKPGGDNSSCLDECDIPNGNGILEGNCDCEGNILGCDGVCGSGLEYDICLVCGGGAVTENSCGCENLLETKDCLGECGGVATVDECGVCNGDNSLCTGCMIIGSDNYSQVYTIPNNESCFVDYSSTIQPIFDNHCTGCHGSSGDLDLSSYQSLMAGGIHGPSVIPNNANESILIEKINPDPSFGGQMGDLSQSIINKISAWIDLGALGNN